MKNTNDPTPDSSAAAPPVAFRPVPVDDDGVVALLKDWAELQAARDAAMARLDEEITKSTAAMAQALAPADAEAAAIETALAKFIDAHPTRFHDESGLPRVEKIGQYFDLGLRENPPKVVIGSGKDSPADWEGAVSAVEAVISYTADNPEFAFMSGWIRTRKEVDKAVILSHHAMADRPKHVDDALRLCGLQVVQQTRVVIGIKPPTKKKSGAKKKAAAEVPGETEA